MTSEGSLPSGSLITTGRPLTRLVFDICFGPTLGGDLGDVHFLVLNLNLSRRTESKYPQREDTDHGCVQPIFMNSLGYLHLRSAQGQATS